MSEIKDQEEIENLLENKKQELFSSTKLEPEKLKLLQNKFKEYIKKCFSSLLKNKDLYILNKYKINFWLKKLI